MLLRDPHTIVIVPGLRGHVEEHWQTHLAHQHPDARIVCSFGRDKRDLDGRVEDLQEVVAAAGRPVTLVAHSAGCLVTLHWARRYGAAVSVTGTANLLDDRNRVAELWSTAARAFWESKDDPNIRVLKVRPAMAEFWDSPGKVVTTVKMAAAAVTGSRPDLGTNRKVLL